jgi:predicted dehydrogenase
VQILGTRARIEIEIPFNAPPDRPCRIFLDGAAEEFPACDQYTLQGDLFSRAIRDGGEVPVPLEDSLGNMAVIEAAFESARTGSATRLLR